MTDIPALIAEVENSHREIATLTRALELACERNAEYAFCGGTEAMKSKHAKANYQYFIQQAQEQLTHEMQGEARIPSCTNCQNLFGCQHRRFEPNDYEPCAEYQAQGQEGKK